MQVQVQRVRSAWATMPRRAQIAVIGVAVATIFMLFFVIRASTSTEWSTVTEAGLTPDKLGEAQTVLEEEGYEVRESQTGGALEVPREVSSKASAALIAGGFAAKGNRTTCAEMFGEKGSLGVSDTSKTTAVKIETCQEGQTANDIEQLDGIEKASVDVTLADTSLFTEEAQPAKASVVLDTDGTQLSSKTVKGIQGTVAARFEGLKPSAVAIIDETGASISKTAEDESGDNQSKKLEIESKYNALTEAKLKKQFEGIVGPGNVAVISNAELDLDEIERQVAEFAPPEGGEPLVQLEDYEKELLRGAGEAPVGGVAGTGSNATGVDPDDRRTATADPVGGADGEGDYASDKNKATYALNQVRENIKTAPGTVLRNRGAVIVDESVDDAAANAVSNAMQAWMGGNTQDSFSFSRAPLASAKPVTPVGEGSNPTEVLAGYLKWALLGIGLIGLAFVLRRSLTQRTAELLAPADDLLLLDSGDFTPIPIAELEAALAAGQPDQERATKAELQRKVEQIADAKPQDVANELRRWMTSPDDATAAFGQNPNRRAS